jgi:uncharacterized protein (DUF58 family)
VLAGLGLLAALATGRPELAALAAPFAAVLVVGLSLAEEPDVEATVELDRERQVQGESVAAEVALRSGRPVAHLEVLLDLPYGLLDESPNPQLLSLRRGEARVTEHTLRCERWGGYVPDALVLRMQDPFGLVVHERTIAGQRPLKVFPHGESLRRLLRPLETQAFVGSQVPRSAREGIEFADLRPFEPGDRVRRVNWRATARRGTPWVTETHPSGTPTWSSSSTRSSRPASAARAHSTRPSAAAASLVRHYLAERDRVGLVAFGGSAQLADRLERGRAALPRLDSLLDAGIYPELRVAGPRLPSQSDAAVEGARASLSPLLDERAVRALLDLRARGFDLAVIEISPVPFCAAGWAQASRTSPWRLWLLRREALPLALPAARRPRSSSGRAGEPLEAALEEVRRFRAPRPVGARLATAAGALFVAIAPQQPPRSDNRPAPRRAVAALGTGALLCICAGLALRAAARRSWRGFVLLGAEQAVRLTGGPSPCRQVDTALRRGLPARRRARVWSIEPRAPAFAEPRVLVGRVAVVAAAADWERCWLRSWCSRRASRSRAASRSSSSGSLPPPPRWPSWPP